MKPVIALTFSLTLLSACTPPSPPTATFLAFTESATEGQEYPVRMLVSQHYLRIEDGDGRDGFILFDRTGKTVYSINHGERSMLVLRSRPVSLTPPKHYENRSVADNEKVPPVDGKTVIHYRLTTNNQRCFDVYAADGLLPDAVAALREYHEVLAGEQGVMQARIPKGFASDCDMVDQVFQPARYLAHGFPVRQINRAGVIRQLVNYKTGAPIEPGLFTIPKTYKAITPGEIRG